MTTRKGCLAAVLSAGLAAALDNGVALTPPMGWNSWNHFNCDKLNEAVIRETAQAMVANGLRDAGYVYVNLDDCWEACEEREPITGDCLKNVGRGEDGKLRWDPIKFPSGLKALGDFLHENGFKFGIYTSSGPLTCSRYEGSWQHEFEDAATFADWGVDFVKVDCCATTPEMAMIAYPRWRDAILASGRPMVYSCDTDELFDNPFSAMRSGHKPWTWAPQACNMWRSGPDIKPFWWKIYLNAELNFDWWPAIGRDLTQYSGPGSWADPDIMEVGNGQLTLTQWRTHFMMWCIMGAPLLAGCDVRVMTNEVREILTAPELIAVNQDAQAKPGYRVNVGRLSGLEVWAKNLANGDVAVLLLNRGLLAFNGPITVKFTDIGFKSDDQLAVRDLWERKLVGEFKGSYTARNIPSCGAQMIRVTRVGVGEACEGVCVDKAMEEVMSGVGVGPAGAVMGVGPAGAVSGVGGGSAM